GARGVGFTVLAMSLSLGAVFIPMLLTGGLMGRPFRAVAVTRSVAVMVSLVISLLLTPVMCARLVRAQAGAGSVRVGLFKRGLQAMGDFFWRGYKRSLDWALRHGRLMMLVLLATIGLNFYLYAVVPKGFFPQQDTGQLLGFFRVDQGTSFHAMKPKLDHFRDILLKDPAIESVTGHAGGRGGSNSTFMMIQLKPMEQRQATAVEVVNRLRSQFQNVPGARMFLVPQQDIFVGGRQGGSGSYEYSLLASEIDVLKTWLPRVQKALAAVPELVDVDSDVEDKGRRVELVIDRDAATRLGVDMSLIAS